MTGNERDDVPRIPGICGIVPDRSCRAFSGSKRSAGRRRSPNWWVDAVCEGDSALHTRLSAEAAALHAGESGLIALDWNNGNRTILVDARLTGLIVGQTLHTTRAEITARSSRLRHSGLARSSIGSASTAWPSIGSSAAAALPRRTTLHADLRRRAGQPMLIAGSAQTALGAARSAAVTAGSAAGGYDDWGRAQHSMTTVKDTRFDPLLPHDIYNRLYAEYRALHDAFGSVTTQPAGSTA